MNNKIAKGIALLLFGILLCAGCRSRQVPAEGSRPLPTEQTINRVPA